jgi:hypothetical protein
MKIKQINILTALAVGAFLTLGGCKKDDGPIPSRVSVEKVPVISTNVDVISVANVTTTTNVSLATITSFSGTFTISNYFPGTAVPDKIDLKARKSASGATVTNANVKLYKANAVPSYPTKFTVTYADLVALFGATFKVDEVYDFGPDMYVGTKIYEAFPLGITGSGAGLASMPFFCEYARFKIVP